jgi:hypothetical protein
VFNPASPGDPIVFVTIDDVTVSEGNAGVTTATFTVALSTASQHRAGQLRHR